MNKHTFFANNENGKKVEYQVLFSFDSPETELSYVVYTDNETDEDGNVKAYASAYTEKNGEMELIPIETEEEWQLVEEMLSDLEDM